MVKKQKEYDVKLAKLDEVERRNKELETKLIQADAEKSAAFKERDEAVSGVLVAKTAREREILRVFKQAAAAEGVGDIGKPREQKSEFLPNGRKAIPAIYTEMDLTDLMNLQAVEAKTRESIGNDEYVELRDVSGGDVQVVQHKIQTTTDDNGKPVYFMVGAAPKNQDPKTRPQFFHALYTWGQFYLQCYPEKAAAFLEYLLFISKYGVIYSVPTLLLLDSKIRKWYVTHPEENWDMGGKHVTRFVREADLELLLNGMHSPLVQGGQKSKNWQGNAAATQQRRQSSQSRGSRTSASGSGQSWDRQRSRPGGRSGGRRSRDSAKKHRCKNYNFRSCDDPDCRRDHVCFTCGAYDHKAEECPQRYDNFDRRY